MGIVSAITGVFEEVGTWLIEFIPKVLDLFYVENSLTLLGVLAICALAISIFFLIMGLIQRFMHFGG